MRYTTRIIVPPRIRRSGQPGTGGAYRPQVLGVRKSFGFDDPFGVATPGHLGAAVLHPEFAPIFVQQSFAEAEIRQRPPAESMASAMRAVGQVRFRPPWGADADRLTSPQEVENAAAAGFTYFTVDPSEFLRHDADTLTEPQTASALAALIEEGTLSEDWHQPYLDRTIGLPGNQHLTLGLEPLRRAAIRYARAIRHCARLSEAIARANHGRPYEIEVFFGSMPLAATALEHLFIGLELEARGVRLTSLALRLVGPDDAASIRAGDAEAVTARLREHAAVAEFCGPYKLSFHDVSLLPSLLPVLGRCCGDALHVKTRHLSFLEAMRVIYRTESGLFERIAKSAMDSPPGSAREPDDAFLRVVTGDMEQDWLDETNADAALAQSAAALMTGIDQDGRPFRLAIVEKLEEHADIYREQLTALFDKRLFLLNAD